VLSAIHHLAVPDVEDDATEHIQPFAVALPGIAMDADDASVLARHHGLAASNGEARRHIQGGAVRLNDQSVSDDRRLVTLEDLGPEQVVKLSLGKKKHVLVRPV
jgi:tyrosyl-tRNA synthetase